MQIGITAASSRCALLDGPQEEPYFQGLSDWLSSWAGNEWFNLAELIQHTFAHSSTKTQICTAAAATCCLHLDTHQGEPYAQGHVDLLGAAGLGMSTVLYLGVVLPTSTPSSKSPAPPFLPVCSCLEKTRWTAAIYLIPPPPSFFQPPSHLHTTLKLWSG